MLGLEYPRKFPGEAAHFSRNVGFLFQTIGLDNHIMVTLSKVMDLFHGYFMVISRIFMYILVISSTAP